MSKDDKKEMEKAVDPPDSTTDKIVISQAARMLGDVWFLLIMQELMDGKKRFSEIESNLAKFNPKVNSQTLSGRLKALEQQGFLTRTAFAEVPLRVEYELTEKGLAVSDVLTALGNYGRKYLAEEFTDEQSSTATNSVSKTTQTN